MDEGTSDSAGAAPKSPAAPPTVPGRLVAFSSPTARHSTWVRVFGILSIVLGVLAAMQGAGNLMSPGVFKVAAGMTPGAGPATGQAMDEAAELTALLGMGMIPLGLLNVTAGILLLLRTRRALFVLGTWAIVKILFSVVAGFVTYRTQSHMMLAMTPAASGAAPPKVVFQVMAAVFGVMMLLWGWVYPVIVLCWMTRPSLRNYARSWGSPRSSARHADPAGP